MKDNPMSARKRMKRWRKANLKRHRAVSAAWKANHPTWYIGPSKIRLLTTALVNGNEKSKVWNDAGWSMDDWCERFRTFYTVEQLETGSRLAPFRNWTHYDMTNPVQLRLFLHPDNFQLLKK